MRKVGMWLPIAKEPKTVRKGLMRLYSFEPTKKRYVNDFTLPRQYRQTKQTGSRVCDAYMDIPLCDFNDANGGGING